MKRAWLLFALSLAGAGCHGFVRHRPTNAPGVIDVMAPPREPQRTGEHAVEAPGDPGEQMLVVSAGGLYGGGARFADDTSGHGWLTGEISVLRGVSDRSHYGDDFFIYPQRSWGLNLGFTFLEDDTLETGPMYVELQKSNALMSTFAGGLAFDLDDRVVGPQLSASFATLFVRGSYLWDRGVELQIGMVWKLPTMWLWSR